MFSEFELGYGELEVEWGGDEVGRTWRALTCPT
jgi:hypothetical protein